MIDREYIAEGVLIILMITLGWFLHMVYYSWSNQRAYDGLHLNDVESAKKALEIAYDRDSYADWVCVNTKGMSIEDVIRTCEHESAHEIFAVNCEKNITKCIELSK